MRYKHWAMLLTVVACSEPIQPANDAPSLSIAAGGEKRWIVVFHQQNGLPRDAEQAIASAGGAVATRLSEIGVLVARSSDPDFVAKIQKSSGVAEVTEDIEVQMIPESPGLMSDFGEIDAAAAGGPTEPPGPDPQPGTDNLYNQQWDKMRVNASLTGSYAVQRGRRDVVVGILDTGVEFLPTPHIDIAPNLDVARSRSFFPATTPDGDPNPAAWDDKNGHGSWCASAVAAPINVFGISGVAPNVTLVALKVLGDNGSGSYTAVAQALIYAANNRFDVASMSLGGYLPHSDKEAQTLINVVQRAVNYARANGVTPVAALGNDNFDISDGSFVRNFIFVPAELPGVIGVSSTGYTNRKAFYSNYGVGKTDVAAPGGGSTTFDPMPPTYHGNGRVLGAYATEAIGTIGAPFREEQCEPQTGGVCFYYAWIRGTSMATPNAAGVVALIVSQYGDFGPSNGQKTHMSPQRVEAILQQTANNQACADNGPYAAPFDIYNATCNGGPGYNNFFGNGIVDALKAVTNGG